MSIFDLIKKRRPIVEDLEDEEPFGMSIDQYDDSDFCDKAKNNDIISPGDDGYEDEDEEF